MATVTYEQLLNSPVSNLPPKTLIDAYFDGTKYMHEFGREYMLAVLKTLVTPSPQEIAVRDTYYKMVLLLQSLLAMNTIEHFQGAATLTRSLFELWLDLKILAQDTTGNEVRKYNAFPEIERYRTAEQLIRFEAAHPQSIQLNIPLIREYYEDPDRKRRLALYRRNPRSTYPQHWTEMTVRRRAQNVGEEATYVEAYPLLSWYVHAGSAGTSGMNKQALEAIFGFCHGRIQKMFVDATLTCARTTRIDKLDGFGDRIKDIERKTGELIVQEQITLLQNEQKQSSHRFD